MSRSRAMRVAWALGIVVVTLVVVHGVANLAGGGSFDNDADRTIYGAVQVIAGALMAAGLGISARFRRGSIALVAAGVIAISVAMPWFIVFTIPIGVGLIALANSRRRLSGGGTRAHEAKTQPS